jgi:hypothetical protein
MQTACSRLKLMNMNTKEELLQARFRLNMHRIAGLTELVVRGGVSPVPATITIESEEV